MTALFQTNAVSKRFGKFIFPVNSKESFLNLLSELKSLGVKFSYYQSGYSVKSPSKRNPYRRTAAIAIVVDIADEMKVVEVVRCEKRLEAKMSFLKTKDIKDLPDLVASNLSESDKLEATCSDRETNTATRKLTKKDLPFKIKAKDVCSEFMDIANSILKSDSKITLKDIQTSYGITVNSEESTVIHMSRNGFEASLAPEIHIKKEMKRVVREVSVISGFSFPEREAKNKEINEIKAQMAVMMEKLSKLER